MCSCNSHKHSFSSSYSSDDSLHWYECECGEISGEAEHTWNNGAVTLQPTTDSEGERTFTCTVCRAKKIEKIEKLTIDHTHVYDIVNYDENNHWNECVCGEKDKKIAHEFDDGQLNADLVKVYSCDCGYIMTAFDTEGTYSATRFITIDGEALKVVYTEVDENGICEIISPSFDGYVAEYDRLVVNANHDSMTNVIYLSPISLWDGASISDSLLGSGTAEDPYLIRSAEDFVYLGSGDFSGEYFKMMTSVDLGNNAFSIDAFGGILDGNHCSVRGINISSTTEKTGLFSVLESDSAVYDLSLYGTVSGVKYTGALAGISHGELRNIVNFATVSGAGNLGGIVGNSSSTSRVTYCTNYGEINGSSWNNGGIVGFAQNVVSNCKNHGNVTTSGDSAGGVVGTSHSYVSYCINYGNVTALGRSGGVVYNSKKLVDNCVNYGDVSGGWDLGGILGYVAYDCTAEVKNCVNNGNVSGNSGIGGIFGFTDDMAFVKVVDCTNNGNVSVNWGGGGIAGNCDAEISGCINNGTVSGQGEIGGIAGKMIGKITECTNNGEIRGTNDIIGGIVGHLHLDTYGEIIWTTNEQKGTVTGPNAQQIIGKGYVYSENTEDQTGPITVEEFNAQPAMYGSPWMSANTRMKIVVKIRMTKGTTITFLGDTSVYCWGVMETTDKDNASEGAWKDSGWNTSWANPEEKTYTTTYATGYFVITVGKLDASGKPNIALSQAELDNIHSMFRVEGEKAADSGTGSINKPTIRDEIVSVNHRGWHEAPENTLSAYRESYKHGFKYVECDVQFTKDGVAILLHDDTIDRTSNGSGLVSQMTYAELLQYDFSYDSADTVNDFSAYRGEKIPTFVEFIALCKELGLHPYIEIKGNLTDSEAQQLVQIVDDAGMLDNVSWLGFSGDALAKIVNIDKTARLVWVLSNTYDTKLASNSIPYAEANLMTGENEVVFDIYYTNVNQSMVDLLKKHNIPLEVWTVNDYNVILNLNPYVSGVSSDCYHAGQILADAGITK